MIVGIDAAPSRQWFESYYGSKIGDTGKVSAVAPEGKKSKHALRSLQKEAKISMFPELSSIN